jgi:hypothetical protein
MSASPIRVAAALNQGFCVIPVKPFTDEEDEITIPLIENYML